MYLILFYLKSVFGFLQVDHQQNLDNPHTSQLYGNLTFGYYYVNIYLGDNFTKHSLVVDTGSSITTTNCNQCKSCGKHENPSYQFEQGKGNSTILKEYFRCPKINNDHCTFEQRYVEQSSISGFYVLDNILFGDELKKLDKNIQNQEQYLSIIGCTTMETGQLATQKADGILGLAPNTNSSFYPPSFVDLLIKKERNLNRCFSLCLGINGGFMSIGKDSGFRSEQSMEILQIQYKPQKQFQVIIKQIKYGDQILEIQENKFQQGEGVFIDSGATMSHADPFIISALNKAIEKYINQQNLTNILLPEIIKEQYCFKKKSSMSKITFYSLFPNISFTFSEQIIIDWQPKHYLYYYLNNYCIGVFQLSNRMILGQNWMRERELVFNLENETISIKNSNCSISNFNISLIENEESNFMEETILEEEILMEENEETETTIGFIRYPAQDSTIDLIEEYSFLLILFYLFIALISCKGIIFLGLYIMKKSGGYIYKYKEKQKFKPLENEIHFEDNNHEQVIENIKDVELELQNMQE